MFYCIPPSPLYTPLLAFIAGILSAFVPLTLYSSAAIAGIVMMAISIHYHYKQELKKSLYGVLFFAGAGYAITTYNTTPAQLPPTLTHYRYTVLNEEHIQANQWPFKITVQTCPRSWWERPLTFLIYTQKKGSLTIGDHIKIPYLSVQQPTDPHFALYLAKEGFDGTAFIFSLKTFTKERPRFSLLRSIYSVKKYCIELSGKVLDKNAYALFLSVFLGNKDEQKQTLETIRPHFLNWGISHQLARSGLHLIFFIPFSVFLMSLLPLPFFIKEFIMIIIVGAYALFSWTSISFLRACCCFFILRATTLFSFFMPPLHILMLTALLVLIHNPLQLFFLDFQLSFFLSLALLWMSHVNQQRTLNDRKTLAHQKRISLE